MSKLTLDEFRKIKKSMQEYYKSLDEYELKDFYDIYGCRVLEETSYRDLQRKLLSYDLSDIPFEEWKGLYLVSDNLDFSKTHANIDFSLLAGIAYRKLNCHGCNIKGSIPPIYNKNTFDSKFMDEHPEFFPEKTLPRDVQEAFYKRYLIFLDLIKYPSLKKIVNKYSFGYCTSSYELIRIIGFNNAMRLLDEYPDFVYSITDSERGDNEDFGSFNFSNKESFNRQDDYEKTKKYLYEIVINQIKKKADYGGYYKNFLKEFLSHIPQEMMDSFPNIFIREEELSEDIKEKYYTGTLTISDIQDNIKILKTKDLEFGTKNSDNVARIREVFGSIENYIEQVPHDLYNIVSSYLDHHSNKIKENDMNIPDIIKAAVEEEAASIPTYVRLNYLHTLSKYVSVDEMFKRRHTEQYASFFKKVDIKTFTEFNQKNNMVFGEELCNNLLEVFIKYVNQLDDDIFINSEEQLVDIFEKIIHKIRSDNSKRTQKWIRNYDFEELKDNKYRLSEIFSLEFMDYNKPLLTLLKDYEYNNQIKIYDKLEIIGKLEKGFDGETEYLFQILGKYPFLISAIENRNLIVDDKYQELYERVGQKVFLEICCNYGEVISSILASHYSDTEIKMKEELMKLMSDINRDNYKELMNQYTYKLFTTFHYKNFDLRLLGDSFKKEHPELYLDDNAPMELQNEIYTGKMNPKLLQQHPDWIPFLNNIDLSIFLEEIYVHAMNLPRGIDESTLQSNYSDYQCSLYKVLSLNFSNQEILEIVSKYYSYIHYSGNEQITVRCSSREEQLESIMSEAYRYIINGEMSYLSHRIFPIYNNKTLPPEFIKKYPDIFLSESAPKELQELFYDGDITSKKLQQHPEWREYLQEKNVKVGFRRGNKYLKKFVGDCKSFKLENEQLFNLLDKYGFYIEQDNEIEFRLVGAYGISKLDSLIQYQIARSFFDKKLNYDGNLNDIISEQLLLEKNVPINLKKAFYHINESSLTFESLKKHKDWLDYLNDKDILLSLAYSGRSYAAYGFIELFNKYGREEALKIGIKNPESVTKMLETEDYDTLFDWYDKLQYVPHYVVMKEFPFEQSDKFIASNKKWLQLMKIERHNLTEDSKSALLKASMCFGVFDNDMAGFQETVKLFSDVPKKLSEQNYQKIVDYIQEEISSLENDDTEEKEQYNNKLELLKKWYKPNEEGIYTLRMNSQQDKKSSSILRTLMEDADISTILTADKSHKLFGGFAMKYEPDFRDFILKNMDTILSSDEYISYVSSMQKQWREIKSFNSNRVLTLNLAMAYIRNNQFENTQIGNENLAELSNMAGYDQNSFDVLQQIYNYGKTRTFNSIPRVCIKNDKYTCEIVRLDDAIPLVVGTLTDCCQALDNAAEVSMEHSMVSEHGRLFVIKDEEENIVAQSWVWRNKNVLCFDNIEIPCKAFTRAERSGVSSEEFADTIYELYKQVGEELIKKDEMEYDKLLEKGKITEEQYKALKLAKITVGLGFNDIAESLKRNSKIDKSDVVKPLSFVPPVDLSNTLYTDSSKQFIIAGQQNVKDSNFDTPAIYADEFIIHDDSNTTERDALTLEKLELITNGEVEDENIYYGTSDRIVSDIAYNYDLNPNTTRVIMNANFAIVYDKNNDNIVIGDILYNDKIYNDGGIVDVSDKVTMQIRMALEQIGAIGKNVDTSSLNAKKMEIYNKAINLNEELDIERGISHGTR